MKDKMEKWRLRQTGDFVSCVKWVATAQLHRSQFQGARVSESFLKTKRTKQNKKLEFYVKFPRVFPHNVLF